MPYIQRALNELKVVRRNQNNSSIVLTQVTFSKLGLVTKRLLKGGGLENWRIRKLEVSKILLLPTSFNSFSLTNC